MDRTLAPMPLITGPLSIGDLLDRTFRVVRARFGILALTVSVILAPLGLVMGVLTGSFVVGYRGLFEMMAASTEQPDSVELGRMAATFAGYFGVIGLLALASALATTYANLAVTFHVHAFLHGDRLTLGQGLRRAWRRFLPALGMSLLQYAIIGAATLVVLIAVVIAFVLVGLLIGGVGTLAGEESFLGALAIVGIIVVAVVGYLTALALALAPAAYLGTRWAGALPGLALESLGPVAALRRSWLLTQRRFWRTFAFVALLAILNLLVVSLPLSVLQQVALLLFGTEVEAVVALVAALSYLVNLIWQPFYTTGIVLLYYDLRVRAESYDLMLRVQQLEAEAGHDAA